ncbi:MAG TPA: CNNM domain-containing protein [Chthoniobacterales bacterium]|jgi:putative hemolysin|nr:CNNM domain-containing protein [Chthoniobacterales bacterium]
MRDAFIIIGCWAISFLFNGIEAGLASIDPVRLRYHVKLNQPAAMKLDRLLKTPGHLLGTVLLVTNFVEIIALLLLTRFLVSKFGAAGFGLAIVVALPIYLFVLSVLPKSLFRRFPFRSLSPLARLLEVSMKTLWPVLAMGAALGRLFLPTRKKRARLFAAREELKQITAESEREGSLTATERAMIHNVFDFQNVTARDVMTPLSKVPKLKLDSRIDEAFNLSKSSAVDRLPVIDAGGDAVGLVNVLDILLDKDRPQSLNRYLRRMVTVQENEPAARAIRRLRAARLGLAAVLDQKRNLIGVITSEDLIARLVRA